MNRMDAEEILQRVMSGTTATMLACKSAVGSSRQCRQRCSLARPGRSGEAGRHRTHRRLPVFGRGHADHCRQVGTCGIRQEVGRAAVENPEGKAEGRQVETQGGQQKPVKFATRIPFSRACPISVREQKQPLWKTSLSCAHGSCRYSGSYAFIGTSDGQSESRPR